MGVYLKAENHFQCQEDEAKVFIVSLRGHIINQLTIDPNITNQQSLISNRQSAPYCDTNTIDD
jgi:hypothetical protein